MSTAFAPLSAVNEQVDNVTRARAEFEHVDREGQDLTQARKRLQHEAQRLVELLEEPNDAVWSRIFQVRKYCFARCED